MIELPHDQHNIEIFENQTYWENKPLLRKIYLEFYKLISQYIINKDSGKIVELGSGIGNLKMVVPNSICTDIFPNPWLDQVENAYKLTFENNSVSDLILFDVWHHLEYPGDALDEFSRVLEKGGRVIIFDPAISLLGRIVYGIFHHEPIAYKDKINWNSDKGTNFDTLPYYAAQGNATKIFFTSNFENKISTNWNVVYKKRLASISYVLSGGYRGRQLYPFSWYGFMIKIDELFSYLPSVFGVRAIIVLEKK